MDEILEKRISPEAYSEVYEVLNKYAFVYDKIPKEVIKFIKKRTSKTYVVKYPIQENILNYISKEALELYTALYLEYAVSEAQKLELRSVLVNNELKLNAQNA